MSIVLDASITMSWCFDDEATAATDDVLKALVQTGAEVPSLWPFEVANALIVAIRRQKIGSKAAGIFLDRLTALPIQIDDLPDATVPVLLPLALRHGLTAYDAAYLDLAMRTHSPLATLDDQLIGAARKEGVQILGRA